jgi:type IV pilus assembly protein PilO
MALGTFFDPIIAAPRWQKVVLGLLGVALIGGGGYFGLLSTMETRIGALRTQHASLQTELAQARAAAADVTRTQREIAALEQKLDTLKERLPGEKEMPPLYRTISDAAFQSGLAVPLFQPREGKTRDYYVEFPITVSAEGGYHQLGQFFERIAAFPRVVTVQELKVSAQAKSKHPVKAELTLATYTYRPVGSPPAPKPGQPGAGQ